jgi:hypothetical protein
LLRRKAIGKKSDHNKKYSIAKQIKA